MQGRCLCCHLEVRRISPLQTGRRVGYCDFPNTLLTMHCNSFGQFHRTTSPGLGKHQKHASGPLFMGHRKPPVRAACFGRPGLSTEFVAFRDQEKGKEKVYLLRQCNILFLILCKSPSQSCWLVIECVLVFSRI